MASPYEPTLAREAIFVVGATAGGKSAVGLALAERIGGEILSLDSMAIYRGMDIGTAKPSAHDQTRVRHHLLDIVDPTVDFALTDYLTHAAEAIADVQARGKRPIFVGGTALYLKSLLRGIFEGPPADPDFRAAVHAEATTLPPGTLHARLAQVDPVAASKLHPHDTRRLIRALEVYRATGVPISHLQMQFDEGREASECHVYQLLWPRDRLHARIAARVEAMFDAGLVDEVRGLIDRHGALSRTASQAVGYREVLAYLDGGPDRPTTIEQVTIKTRQFAKAQETWFRSLSEVTVIPMTDTASPTDIADDLARRLGERPA